MYFRCYLNRMYIEIITDKIRHTDIHNDYNQWLNVSHIARQSRESGTHTHARAHAHTP